MVLMDNSLNLIALCTPNALCDGCVNAVAETTLDNSYRQLDPILPTSIRAQC